MVMVMVVVVVVVVAVCVWVVVVAVCVWVEGGNAPLIHSSCRKRVLHLFSTGLIEGRFDYKKGLHVPGSRQTLYGDPLLNQFRNFLRRVHDPFYVPPCDAVVQPWAPLATSLMLATTTASRGRYPLLILTPCCTPTCAAARTFRRRPTQDAGRPRPSPRGGTRRRRRGHQAEPAIVSLSSLYPQAPPLLVCAENSKRGGPAARRAPRNELPFVVVLRRVLRLRY